jgi:hypothetical protein
VFLAHVTIAGYGDRTRSPCGGEFAGFIESHASTGALP